MDSETKRLLVVDDNAMTARWVECLAQRMGLQASVASNGAEALDRLAEEHFAAVISDVEMPVMNGFELLQQLRLRYPEIPIVLMSISRNEEWREAAIAWGAKALLEKPIDMEKVAALLGIGGDSRQALPPVEKHIVLVAA